MVEMISYQEQSVKCSQVVVIQLNCLAVVRFSNFNVVEATLERKQFVRIVQPTSLSPHITRTIVYRMSANRWWIK